MKARTRFNRLHWALIVTLVVCGTFISNGSRSDVAWATPEGLCNGYTDVTEHNWACASFKFMNTTRTNRTEPPVGGNSGSTCINGAVSSPCILPKTLVTRQQFAKMIVNTYNTWNLVSPATPTFSDVPSNSPLYTYVETAFARGIISGYSNPKCSNLGVAAPCFAPNETISRQQMAKMNALAAGFSDDLTNRQATYSDMPRPATLTDPNSFFQYVERLTMHTALGYYPLDLSQPACTVVNNKPCMHPGVFATRADAWNSIYMAYIYRGSAVAGGIDYYAQVFPRRAHINNQLVGYTGVYAVVTTPNTNISAGTWIAAPVSISNAVDHFTESGPQKFCWNDGTTLRCEIHPYASWRAGVGNTTGGWDASRPLVPGTKYVYQSERYTGSTTRFKSYYCLGDESQCYTIQTPDLSNGVTGDMGLSSFLYYIAGGESNSLFTHWGTISIESVSAQRADGAWYTGSSACYDPTLVPIQSQWGTYSVCSNASWQVQY